MISPNDYEPSPIRIPVTKAKDMHKAFAKAAVLIVTDNPLHCQITKRAKLEGGVAGFDEGHTVIGYTADKPEVGKPFAMERYNSEGHEQYGFFYTSRVESIEVIEGDFILTTQNSIYTLEFTPDPLAT